jgi:hypothetical protein
MNIWKDIKFLNKNYKNIINNYFLNKTGKFKITDNILTIDFDNWGIEKFYFKDDENDYYNDDILFYNIIYNNFRNIYNICISIQIGNWYTFKKMESYLSNFKNINVNIYFVLINDIVTDDKIEYLKEKYKYSVILSAENRGMDIGLFLINLHFMKKNKYIHDFIFKIHTKTNDDFRNQTLNILMENHEKIIENIKILNKDDVGMYSGNFICKFSNDRGVFESNYYHLKNLVNYLYGEEIDTNNLEFVAGTMFIVKNKIFNILTLDNIEYLYKSLNNVDTLDYYWYSVFYKININQKDKIESNYSKNIKIRYPNNMSYSLKTNKPGLRDCMIEHAMERLFGYICKKNNLNIVQ